MQVNEKRKNMVPYIGEITLFAFNKIPVGWLPCEGQLLQINQNAALYSLIRNIYGGDGRTNFALPDLRGRVVVNQSFGASPKYTVGTTGGVESVTLNIGNIPQHSHNLQAVDAPPANNNPAGHMLAKSTFPLFESSVATVQLAPTSIATAGASVPHENRQPLLALVFCIATIGLYPSRG
jgi:microcystin-dependent protein